MSLPQSTYCSEEGGKFYCDDDHDDHDVMMWWCDDDADADDDDDHGDCKCGAKSGLGRTCFSMFEQFLSNSLGLVILSSR